MGKGGKFHKLRKQTKGRNPFADERAPPMEEETMLGEKFYRFKEIF